MALRLSQRTGSQSPAHPSTPHEPRQITDCHILQKSMHGDAQSVLCMAMRRVLSDLDDNCRMPGLYPAWPCHPCQCCGRTKLRQAPWKVLARGTECECKMRPTCTLLLTMDVALTACAAAKALPRVSRLRKQVADVRRLQRGALAVELTSASNTVRFRPPRSSYLPAFTHHSPEASRYLCQRKGI